jgi:hypothetical protein
MNEGSKETNRAGYEKSDAQFRVIAMFTSALLIVLVAVAVVTQISLRVFSRRAVQTSTALPARPAQLPPESRLQIDPMAELQALRKQEDLLLYHYAWIDRTRGVVRIPIDRAIDLTTQRSLPARRKS